MSQCGPDGDDAVKTPRCPMCDGAPVVPWLNVVPWFCGNDVCDLLTWDPYSSLDDNLMSAKSVQLPEFPPESDENSQ